MDKEKQKACCSLLSPGEENNGRNPQTSQRWPRYLWAGLVSLCLSLCVSVYLCVSVFLFPPLPLPPSLTFCLYLSLSPFFSLSLPLSPLPIPPAPSPPPSSSLSSSSLSSSLSSSVLLGSWSSRQYLAWVPSHGLGLLRQAIGWSHPTSWANIALITVCSQDRL